LKAKVLRHQIFYFPPDSLHEGSIVFSAEESQHMVKSLRLGVGDRVRATDGAGRFYDSAIEHAAAARVRARVLKVTEAKACAPAVTVFQGVVRAQRMDLLVEKAVELGSAGLVPIECERCLRRVAAPRLARWRRIAREAMKQSLRAHLPAISEPRSLREAAAVLGGFDLVLVACEASGGKPLREIITPGLARVALWVGPEGGFTEEEMDQLAAAGGVAFTLGPHRLRSETAALATLAALHQLVA